MFRIYLSVEYFSEILEFFKFPFRAQISISLREVTVQEVSEATNNTPDMFVFRVNTKSLFQNEKCTRDISPLTQRDLFLLPFCSSRCSNALSSLSRSVDLQKSLEMSQTVIFGLLLERIAAREPVEDGTHNRGNVSRGCNKFPDDTRCIHSNREDDGFYGLPVTSFLSPSCTLLRIRRASDFATGVASANLFKGLQVYCDWKY